MRRPCEAECLRGALRYRLAAAPIVTSTCHCTACQRITGSAFSAAMILPAEACRCNVGATLGVARSAQPRVTLPPGGTLFAAQPEDGAAWLRSILTPCGSG